jgi:hypothetical protein
LKLVAMVLHEILEAARIAGGCDEAITGGEHGFRDIAVQSASHCRSPATLST